MTGSYRTRLQRTRQKAAAAAALIRQEEKASVFSWSACVRPRGLLMVFTHADVDDGPSPSLTSPVS